MHLNVGKSPGELWKLLMSGSTQESEFNWAGCHSGIASFFKAHWERSIGLSRLSWEWLLLRNNSRLHWQGCETVGALSLFCCLLHAPHSLALPCWPCSIDCPLSDFMLLIPKYLLVPSPACSDSRNVFSFWVFVPSVANSGLMISQLPLQAPLAAPTEGRCLIQRSGLMQQTGPLHR